MHAESPHVSLADCVTVDCRRTADLRSAPDPRTLDPIDPAELDRRRLIEAHGYAGALAALGLREYADPTPPPPLTEPPAEFAAEVRRAVEAWARRQAR